MRRLEAICPAVSPQYFRPTAQFPPSAVDTVMSVGDLETPGSHGVVRNGTTRYLIESQWRKSDFV